MFQRKPNSPQLETPQRESFPTFRRWARLDFPTLRRLWRFSWKIATRLPFVSRAWWKRNGRRLAATCLALAAIWTATNIYATILLNRELEAIRQRGEPLTMAELAPPPVPDNQNAALAYERAYKTLKKLPWTGGMEWNPTTIHGGLKKPLSPQQVSLIRRCVLQQCRPAIEMTRQASRLPLYRSSMNWSQSATTLEFTQLAPLRELARLMNAAAIQEAQDGQTEQAIADVGVIYYLGEHIASDPVLVPLLVSVAINNMGHDALAQVFEYSKLTAAQQIAVEAIFPRLDQEENYARAMRGERTCIHSTFQELIASQTTMLEVSKLIGGSEDAADNVYMSVLFLMSTRFGRILWCPMIKLDEVWFLRSNPANTQPLSLTSVPDYAIFTKLFLQSYQNAHAGVERANDLENIARIALALNVWKNTHKTYPKYLSAFKTFQMPSLQNALNRKTIGYKTEGNQFLLYSFGVNRRDDGGKSCKFNVIEQAMEGEGDDVTWNQSLGQKPRS